jgi:hypothetical protein
LFQDKSKGFFIVDCVKEKNTGTQTRKPTVIDFEKEQKLQKLNQLLRNCSDELFDLVCQAVESACERENI